MNNNIPIVINDIEFPPMTIEAYARMYYPESNLWSYENKETRSRVCLVDAPNSAMALGYVNGLFIPRGGTHIIAVYEEALRIIESTGLVAKKKRKGKEPDKDDKSKADKTDKAKEADLSLNIGDLERNMAVFISVRIDKPLFTSQAKERLKSKIEIPLPDSGIHSFTKAVKDWYLIKQLQVVLEAKDLIRLKSTDGIKTKRVHIKRLEDANLAGTNKSGQCFLCLVEGDSAEAYISKLRGYIQDGSDTIGIGKLRGKPLNVTSCTIDQLVTNEEIHMIKKALGLREGVDYTDPTNFATLRYGRILVCTDADTDGTHIKGLILLLLTLYPSLFAIPFVYSWESPAVISTKGSEVKLFYRFVEYEHWTETNDTKGWTNRYMKGLGTSDDSDIMRDTRIFKNTRHVIDEGGLERLQSVFDEDAAEMRKDWIKNWKPTTFEAPDQVQTLSDFVDNDLILYARATLPRALPSIVDGMKSVQRKVLYGGILEAPHNKEPMVVSRLAGRIAERTAYHHGPSSIEECIERMGVDHPGTNNMPLVMRHGQFGNRKSNRLVAARYPRAKMAWWISSVFRREDDNILVGQTEDGEPIEPAYFIPIIPTLLLNGTRAGVAVAWSTCIPAHHPLRIVEWIKAYLNGDTPTPLQPWYRGYTGNIEIKPNCYVSQGRFEQVGNKVIIRELPLFRLYETYEEFLDELIKTEVIRDYDTKCTDEQPCYILSGMKETPTLHNLRLQRNHSTTNMTVLGVDGVPIQFRSTDEIMYHFCQIRYEAYQRRKVYQLTELDKELAYLRLKLAYLQDVAAGNLIVIKRKNAELNADMAARGYPKTLLNLKGHSFTDDGITNARNEIVKTEEKIRHLTATDVKDIWLGELDEFVAAYHKHYKE
jgi:DNA topoisomerase-2